MITILFADIRGFTTFAEKQLPYDVIHVLNRYFHLMGQVIEEHNGRIDNYMGDGLLAVFESDEPAEAANNAVRAGLRMLAAMAGMQPYLERSYGQKLVRLMVTCLEAPPDIHFGIFHVLSNNRRNRLDIGETRRILGYEPQDDAFAIAEKLRTA